MPIRDLWVSPHVEGAEEERDARRCTDGVRYRLAVRIDPQQAPVVPRQVKQAAARDVGHDHD